MKINFPRHNLADALTAAAHGALAGAALIEQGPLMALPHLVLAGLHAWRVLRKP